MSDKSPLAMILETLVPFVLVGIGVALFFSLLIMFSYVLVWGLMIGGVLWIANTVKQYLFPSTSAKTEIIKKSEGRIIEHDEKK